MSIKQKAIQGVVWSIVRNWGSQAGTLIIFFILARLVEPQDFGLIALANVFLGFMRLFLEQGFGQAIIQREDLEPEHLNTAFWINLAVGVLLAAMGFSGAGLAANVFGEPALTPILRCFSVLFIVSALNKVQQSILERKFQYKTIAARWLVATFAGGAIGILMAWRGFGVWSLVAQQMVYEALGSITLWVCSDWRPGFKVSARHFHDLFGIGVHIMGFNFLTFFNTRINDFLVGYFLGATALGYYTVAYKVLNVMTQLLVNTTRDVALPTFSRLQSDPERFRRAFYKATQLTSTIAFPTFLGMAVLAPELNVLLFGEQWAPSIPLMRILAFMGVLRAITFFKGSVFVAMGKPAWWFWLSVLNATLNLVGFAIALPFGIMAVTAASVIRGYLVFPVGQWAVSKLIQERLSTYLGTFVAPVSSAVVMAGVILIVRAALQDVLKPLELLIVGTAIGSLVYVTMIYLISPKLFTELLGIARMVASRSKTQS
ncbi:MULTISPECIES: lipopolysaccharide biosynthesis protein [unclassified Leptolyngbya]|uniref:lipopolysaccharide biosynthesis protein n=1 Tax=unclassified Leptolyngbya TaxID=2650499 RepID=UPI0016839C8A|nr:MULTISPECIES: lipopolysaccharide biosynthesis protein [unclassified Leptolyngbya]MBD1914253.1 lipopolysaccharide biosynthesis protein [Leptolyngbya sp. FACHB-8]MBD2157260.1 lipopolysaccharide biosynthesis protein [Leptolyngbya sp. FACHB-16]